jgi:hypothetical protein
LRLTISPDHVDAPGRLEIEEAVLELGIQLDVGEIDARDLIQRVFELEPLGRHAVESDQHGAEIGAGQVRLEADP